MRLTRLMGIAVALVAVAATMNALAYKTAAVTNSTSLTISATDSAALAMSAPASTDPGITLSGASTGALTVTITDKMQPNSVYCFASAFKVTNNATSTIIFDATTITNPPTGVTIALFTSGGAGCATPFPTSFLTTASADLDIQVTVGPTALVNVIPYTPSIVINSHR